MNSEQVIGAILVGVVLLAVVSAVISALGWKEGIACILTACIGTAMLVFGFRLLGA